MCGRYTITVTLEELMARYWIDDAHFPFHQPKYNVAPGQMVIAVIHDGKKRRIGELKWGLIPSWADDPKIGYKMINARAETAAERPAFSKPLQRKRCLIPADGFYEWKKTDGAQKQPMRIVRRDREVFSMAGIYETWTSPDGSKISTCSILTTEPNSLMASIHDRMPVILRPEDEALWINRQVQDPNVLKPLFKPFDPDKLEMYPVSAAVGRVSADSPELIEAIDSSGGQLEWF